MKQELFGSIGFLCMQGNAALRLATLFYRYSIHLWDLNHEGTWESKGTYIYYTDFIMELTLLCLDLMHHIHMLVSF